MPEPTVDLLDDLDEEELYVELGKQLLGEGLSFGPEDFARYKTFATTWLTEHIAQIRVAVCGKTAPKPGEPAGRGDALIEAATVADCLAALCGKPAALVAAVILVRRGLDDLCNKDSDQA